MASTARAWRRSRPSFASSASAIACPWASRATAGLPVRQATYARVQWPRRNLGSAVTEAWNASGAPSRQRRKRSIPRSYAANASADVVDTDRPRRSVYAIRSRSPRWLVSRESILPAQAGIDNTTPSPFPRAGFDAVLQCRTMNTQTIRVGFVGAVNNTRVRHTPGFKAQSGVEFVAVANRSKESGERVAREFGIP